MKKCVFILPYFGKFNNYFPLFLQSCKINASYNWLIFTDDMTHYAYPDNVKVVYLTFDELKKLVASKLNIKISLDTPYKLCDFKPTYGLVFEDYISDYEYWGHCDSDVLFGNMEKILDPLLKQGYDKLFPAGHLTIYKNNYNNVRRFMKCYNGKMIYKDFLTVPQICWFDEDWKDANIHSLFIQDNAKVFCDSLAYNPSGKYLRFVQRNYDSQKRCYKDEVKHKSICILENGNLYRYNFNLKNQIIKKEEYLYIHLQHRWMKNYVKNNCIINNILIVPNEFKNIATEPINNLIITKINSVPLSGFIYFFEQYAKKLHKKIKNIRRIKDDSKEN